MTRRVLAVGTAERRTADERRERAARRRAALKDPAGDHQGELSADRARWPEEWREAFEERAAAMEFDGGLPRDRAEAQGERRVRLEHARRFIDRAALVGEP